MTSTVEKLENNQVKLTVTVDAADFDKAVQRAYLKLRNQIVIPGFRRGKAPRKVIENISGEDVFYEDAFPHGVAAYVAGALAWLRAKR